MHESTTCTAGRLFFARRALTALFALLLVTGSAEAATKLTASDGGSGDLFGQSVAIDGTVAIIGADEDDDGGTNAGAAYIYEWDGSAWSESQKLTASDAAAEDRFGRFVAVDGEVIVVSAPKDDDDGANSGAVYVFRYDDVSETWQQEQKLTASNAAAGDEFGDAIAVEGDRIVIGAPRSDNKGADAGLAYYFEYSASSWQQKQWFYPSGITSGDRFGTAVDFESDRLIVGARRHTVHHSNGGAAYIFAHTGSKWSEEAALSPADAAKDDEFGWSVAVDGDQVLIGAPYDDDFGSSSGAAYVFRKVGASWQEQTKLTASDGAADDRFGFRLAFSGGTALIGAYKNDAVAADAGAAYLFHYANLVWTQEAKLTADDGAAGDAFGRVAAMDDQSLLLGARSNAGQGAAYLYPLSDISLAAGAAFPCADAALPDRPDQIIYRGLINDDDNDEDRIIGRWCDAMQSYIPLRFEWGVCYDIPTDPYNKCTTEILYPDWEDLKVSFSVLHVNGDQLPDFVFALSGTDVSGAVPTATGRIISLFGQSFLNIATINLAGIASPAHSDLFYALDLRVDHELTDPLARDISGKLSYKLGEVNVAVSQPPAIIVPPDFTTAADDLETREPLMVRVFPNPADNTARIQARRIPAGSYRIDIAALDGSILVSREVEVGADGEFLRSFDFTQTAAGYYTVKLYTEQSFIGAYPLLIVR